MDFTKIISYLRNAFSQTTIDSTSLFYSLETDKAKLQLSAMLVLQGALKALLQAYIIERMIQFFI